MSDEQNQQQPQTNAQEALATPGEPNGSTSPDSGGASQSLEKPSSSNPGLPLSLDSISTTNTSSSAVDVANSTDAPVVAQPGELGATSDTNAFSAEAADTESASPKLSTTPETGASSVVSVRPASQAPGEPLTNTAPLADQAKVADALAVALGSGGIMRVGESVGGAVPEKLTAQTAAAPARVSISSAPVRSWPADLQAALGKEAADLQAALAPRVDTAAAAAVDTFGWANAASVVAAPKDWEQREAELLARIASLSAQLAHATELVERARWIPAGDGLSQMVSQAEPDGRTYSLTFPEGVVTIELKA